MIEINVTEGEKKTFDRPNYLNFTYGQHLVRILGDFRKVYTHWIKRANVVLECLDEDCPICLNNRRIIAENPDNFSRVPGYVSRSERHYMNVLDRTDVKVCPECLEEVKKEVSGKFPVVCSDGHMIVEVEVIPSNKIKIANVSKTNALRLKDHQLSTLDESGEPIGLENFDIVFMVTRGAERKDIVPMPIKDNDDKVEVPEDALYDLENVVVKLDADEIIQLAKGVSLRDIFLARRAESDDVEELASEAGEEVKSALDELFA